MNQQKEQYRIGKLAQELGVKRFVIRFWEKEFGLKASRSTGGQRFYQKKDFEQFKHIKELLYEKGFTITGAKKILKEPGNIQASKLLKTKGAYRTDLKMNNSNLSEQIILLQKKLIKLRDLL